MANFFDQLGGKNVVVAATAAVLAVGIGVGAGYFAGMNNTAPDKTASETVAEKPAEKSAQAKSAPTGPNWIMDADTKIYLRNVEPTDGESVKWTGGFVQDGDYKYADGYGTVSWFQYGKLKQIDEGVFVKGERDGKFKHKFYPSGRIDFSYWKTGSEIATNIGKNDRWLCDIAGNSHYIVTDTYIDHGDRGAEVDVKIIDPETGASRGSEYYTLTQTNGSRGFRFSTSAGRYGWVSEDPIAREVFNYIAKYLHEGTGVY